MGVLDVAAAATPVKKNPNAAKDQLAVSVRLMCRNESHAIRQKHKKKTTIAEYMAEQTREVCDGRACWPRPVAFVLRCTAAHSQRQTLHAGPRARQAAMVNKPGGGSPVCASTLLPQAAPSLIGHRAVAQHTPTGTAHTVQSCKLPSQRAEAYRTAGRPSLRICTSSIRVRVVVLTVEVEVRSDRSIQS